jgi:eukaryotic-like serine/threonine-protein kinase
MSQPKIGDRISEYVLDEQIGSGSFGQVWKAHHHIWGEELVAIKVPTDSQFVRNLQKEGLTIHGLKHPNIVQAIGLDPYADVPYLVMEYVNGPSLRDLIKEHPKGMPIQAAQKITIGILRALQDAHAHGVIHRDIKPENILINGGRTKPVEEIDAGDVKVTDFGLGRAGQITTASIVQSGSLLSEEGRSVSGTLAYMAPEQREGGECDARTDLYAVGIVLFELVCGERPSGSDMPSHIREGLPSWVDLMYSRLYTRRERRFASSEEALRAIEAASVPPIMIRNARPVSAGTGQRSEGRDHMVCSSCQFVVEPGDNFCTGCGTQLVTKIRRCQKCDAFPAVEDKFCVFCGSPLSAGAG